MDFVIQTNRLFKRYGAKNAVDDVSICVKKGDIYGLIGKNGAGKTTLLKMLLGLARPTKGDIRLFDETPLTEARKNIGSLIEAPGLYKGCTAKENMRRFCLLYGADPAQIQPLLEKVGLGKTGWKKVGAFSLGMKQRLGIAVALLGNPDLLVLDEPTNGLDPAGIKDIRDLILQLHEEGVTFIISSHLLDELAKVVTRYGILADGKLVEEISAAELKAQCGTFVEFTVGDIDDALKILRKNFEDIQLHVVDEKIQIFSHLDEVAKINALLVKKGVAVTEIRRNANGFEEFFIERMGK